MRAFALALTILLLPMTARAETDIAATCYTACETATSSNPEYKACLARAADAARRQTQPRLQGPPVGDPQGREGDRPAPRHPASIAYRRPEKVDRLSGRELHVRGSACLWRHLDRRELLGLLVRAQSGARGRLRPNSQTSAVWRVERAETLDLGLTEALETPDKARILPANS